LHGRRAIGVFALAQVHVDQAAIAPDAVLGVHHGVAHVELGQVFDQGFDIADLLLLFAPAGGGAGGEQLGLGDKVDAGGEPAKTHGEGRGGDAQRLGGLCLELGQRVEGRWVDAARTQEVEQAFTPAIAFGQQQHALGARVGQVGLEAGQRVFGAAQHGQVAQLLHAGAVVDVDAAGADRELGVLVGSAVELLDAQEQGLGRQGGAIGVTLDQAEAVLGVLPEALEGWLQLAMQHHRGIGAQVVKNGGGVVEEQRQVVLDAGRGHAVAHVLVDAALGGVTLQQFAPAAAELGARRVVHGELAPGQQAHLGHGVQAALAVGVEGSDGVDLVIEQVHPEGHGRAHGEEVDQAAAHGVLARADHLRDVAVAGQGELALELGLVEFLLDLEVEGIARQERGRCHPVQRGGGRHDDHVGPGFLVTLLDAPQRGQALGDQVLVGREGVVGQGFPIGKQRTAQAWGEEGDLIDQALGIAGVGGDDGRRSASGFFAQAQAGQQQGIGGTHGAGQGETFSGREFGQFHGVQQWQTPPVTSDGGCASGDFRMGNLL